MTPLHHPDTVRGRHPEDLDQSTALRTIRAGATPTAVAPAMSDSGDPDSGDDEPKLNLSLTQILAGTSAAVIAALLGSRLGVAGTLAGAALASVVSAVGSAIFGHSLLVTRRRLKAATAHVRSAGVDSAPARAGQYTGSEDAATVVLPVITEADLAAAARNSRGASAADQLATSRHPRAAQVDPASSRLLARLTRQWRKALLVTVAAGIAVFGGAVLTVTVAEAIKGSPLSGGAAGGLSVLGGGGGGGGEPAGAPETGPAPSSAPSTTGSDTQETQDAPTTAADPTADGGEVTTPPAAPTTEAPSEAPSEAQPTEPTEPSPTPTAPGGAVEQTPAPTEAPATGDAPTTASDSPPAE